MIVLDPEEEVQEYNFLSNIALAMEQAKKTPSPKKEGGGTLTTLMEAGGKLKGGDMVGAATTAVGLVNPVAGAVVGGIMSAAQALGISFESKSVAGWNRTLGRLYRAGCPLVIAKLIYSKLSSKDPTGAKVYEILVDNVPIPTAKEKNQTKHGFTRDPPVRQPDRPDSGLVAWINAAKGTA